MAEQKMKLEDWLDDLCVRFIINLPREELESVERICFQVEEAQWFYEDFIRPLDPNLPSLNLRNFALLIFQHCPLMSQWSHYHHSAAFSEFLAYKTRVPVRGAILLNEAMDEVVLVKGWKKTAGWSFPRGKINKAEKDLDCAAREVYEETGFDIKQAGLIKDEDKVKYIDISMREQNMRLYVIRGVPMDTYFEPRTRKEISKIEWYKLSDLPTQKRVKQEENNGQNANRNKFYMVAPFLGPLKKWIASQRKRDIVKVANPTAQVDVDNPAYTTADEGPELADGGFLQRSDNIEVPQPTELPEAPANEDPSAQLKRLLNIGHTSQPAPVITHEQAAGSTLLELLRQGSSAPSPQRPEENHPMTSYPNAAPPPPPAAAHVFSSHPVQFHAHSANIAPITMPGPVPRLIGQGIEHSPHPSYFNHQVYQHAPYNTGNSFSLPIPHNYNHPPPPPQQMTAGSLQSYQNHPPQYNRPWPAQPPVSSPGFPAPHITDHARHAPQSIPPPMPYNPGVPQPVQIPQPSTFQAPPIPPASKLPPPKLNSHSLALLNVFKSENSQKSATPSQEMTPKLPSQPQGRSTSEHQENLLKMLKPATSTSTIPGSAPPVRVSPQPSLLRSRNGEPSQLRERTPSPLQHPVRERQNRYSGPQAKVPSASSPRIESILKPNSRRLQQQFSAQPQTAAKPNIVILPRPTSAAKEPLPASKLSEPARSPPKRNATISELTKPFKPKILRRPDRDNLEASLPTQTVTVSAFTKPKKETMLDEPEGPIQTPTLLNYDRREIQSNPQRDTLLSLFNKATPSSENPQPKSPVHSSVVSSLDSPDLQNRGISSPTFSESRPASRGKVTSPADKAFLLGYLDGVVKGKR